MIGQFFHSLSILLLKILYFFSNPPKFNVNRFSIAYFKRNLLDIYHSKNFILIFIVIFILILINTSYITNLYFNLSSFLIYQNRTWNISYITTDNYAICSYNNYIIIIKTDIIKNNYICIKNNDGYYFYEKEKFKEISF